MIGFYGGHDTPLTVILAIYGWFFSYVKLEYEKPLRRPESICRGYTLRYGIRPDRRLRDDRGMPWGAGQWLSARGRGVEDQV